MYDEEVICQVEVDGVEVQLKYEEQPLIPDGQGDLYFEPGYLSITITGDASSGEQDAAWKWDARAVKLLTRTSPKLYFKAEQERYQVVPVPPGEQLERILIRQQHLPVVGYGIYAFFLMRAQTGVSTIESQEQDECSGLHGIAMRIVSLTLN